MIDMGSMKLVNIDSITIGDRGRKEYGDLTDLAQSINTVGLIHPIAVYSETGESPYKLLAGGRRLEACKMLKLTEISCRIYDHKLDEFEIKAIELYENIKRKNLFYVEQTAMTDELDMLFKKLHEKKPDIEKKKPEHSMRDTAKILGKSPASVSLDIELARTIKKFPELGLDKMPNKTAALRALTRMKHALSNAITVQNVETTVGPKTKEMIDAYKLGDFLEESKRLPSNYYHLIEVDPPYGVDIASVRDTTTNLAYLSTQPYVEIPTDEYHEFCLKVLRECWRVSSEDSWLVWWTPFYRFEEIRDLIKEIGWKVCPVPAIWAKGNSPCSSAQPSFNLGNNYEAFFYARKGSASLRRMGRPNVFSFSSIPSTSRTHPMERPLEMMQDIISTFTWEGSRILSPFLGSGTTILAAYSLNMTCVGYDLSEEYRNAYSVRVMKEYQK